MAPAASFKWIKPEIYPLIFYLGATVGLAGFTIGRLLSSHPDVRINKEDRQAGLLYNFKEGQRYHDHALRRYLEGKTCEMTPGINDYFTKKYNSMNNDSKN